MAKREVPFFRILGSDLGADEGEAIVAIAHAMGTANGDMSDDERDAFDQLVEFFADGDNDASLAALVARLDRDAGGDAPIEDNVRAYAAKLRRAEAREAAYKAAYTLRIWDLESNEDEEELDDVLVEALGLGERAGDLVETVNAAISAE